MCSIRVFVCNVSTRLFISEKVVHAALLPHYLKIDTINMMTAPQLICAHRMVIIKMLMLTLFTAVHSYGTRFFSHKGKHTVKFSTHYTSFRKSRSQKLGTRNTKGYSFAHQITRK